MDKPDETLLPAASPPNPTRPSGKEPADRAPVVSSGADGQESNEAYEEQLKDEMANDGAGGD
jgi:hypothetical protein